MEAHIIFIRDLVRADVTSGKIVDVEQCCEQVRLLFPAVSKRDIENAVLQVVIAYGGNAKWGGSELPADQLEHL